MLGRVMEAGPLAQVRKEGRKGSESCPRLRRNPESGIDTCGSDTPRSQRDLGLTVRPQN